MCSALSSCATKPSEPDDLCGQLQAFAAAQVGSEERSVSLTTDWGGTYAEADENGDKPFFEKRCIRGEDAPSRGLCAYLIDNTSTEFPHTNYRRALRCLGAQFSRNPDSPLPSHYRSSSVLGHALGTELEVSFAEATADSPPTLRVLTRGRR
jgi:hypothetical protein